MLRIIRQHPERLAVLRLNRNHGNFWINRTARPDDVLTQMPGMHVGSPIFFAKGIANLRAHLANPSAVMGVLPIIHRSPPHPRRLEVLFRRHNAFRDLRDEKLRVAFIETRAQTTHGRGRGMGVRRRDHHVIHRDPALPTGQRLRFVN